MVWKEFHDVKQRFALVESPDLIQTSTSTFLPVLVETLLKTLDSEFDLLRQFHLVQLLSPGTTISTDQEENLETTTPLYPDIQLVVFRPQEEASVARETDIPGPSVTKIWKHNCQMERLQA
ncbi:hypothetical protein R1flu_016148 [Riccia fluitans]|uniref:Uncharacterized protein n=1 Tax=Riccia fluitans TaxID=41844 RepID=A0ABD1YPV2_9MARC